MKDKIGEGIFLFLLKFTDYPDELLNGNIYMGNLKKYIDIEKENGVKGMGDMLEASQVYRDMDITMRDNSNNQVVLKGKAPSMILRWEGDEKKPVFCTFLLTEQHFKFDFEDEENMHFVLDIEETEIQHMLESFSETLVLIDATAFIKRFDAKSLEKGYNIVRGSVSYDDLSINNTNRIKSYFKDNSQVFFWKDIFFEKQNEYRIVILNEEVEDAMKFNIGDLNDIATKHNAREFFGQGYCIRMPKSLIEQIKSYKESTLN